MKANSGMVLSDSGLWVPERTPQRQRPDPVALVEQSLGFQLSPSVRAALRAHMTLANDSILVTPGVGATVATHLAGAKEHSVVMNAQSSGHILGTEPMYFYQIPSQVHVAVASTVHWDMFNADAALLVRILSILQIPNITTAVTGIVFDWLLERTTAVGTGGGAITAWLAQLNDTALDADITCRSKPTGGATQSTDLRNYSISSEETAAATIQIATQGGLELIPQQLLLANGGKGLVLRQNEGVRCVQVTNSAQGNTGWLIGFTVE